MRPCVVPRHAMLDIWMAFGGCPIEFGDWMADRSCADAWAQLVAAVRGDPLDGDRNPTPGALLDLVAAWARS